MTESPLDMIPKELFKQEPKGKFRPKLEFDERCAVLALDRSRVNRKAIAAAFGIDRRTVGHICNANGVHYKSVRDKYKEMGHQPFLAQYVTPEVVDRLAKLDPEQVADKPPIPAGAPNPRARSSAGFHTVQPDQCAYPHRLEIAFREDGSNAGWHYCDHTVDAEAWLHNGEASLKTSQAALSAAIENLVDE